MRMSGSEGKTGRPDPDETRDDETHEHEDEALDEALDESFPASDPVPPNPGTDGGPPPERSNQGSATP